MVIEKSSNIKTVKINIDRKLDPNHLKYIAGAKHEITTFVDEENNTVILKGLETNIDKLLKEYNLTRFDSLHNEKLCKICFFQMGNDYIELYLCGHIIHKNCFVKALEANLSEFNSIIPIKCLQCPEFIQYEDLSKLCEFELLKKIEFAAVEEFVYNNSNKYAFCENSECKNIYEIMSLKNKIIRFCTECKIKFCIKCKKPAYGNHDSQCVKDVIEEEEDEEYQNWIVQNTTTCPKCFYSFEKAGGCNHMTCPYCKSHFCFLCKEFISNVFPVDHYRNKNSFCYNQYNITVN